MKLTSGASRELHALKSVLAAGPVSVSSHKMFDSVTIANCPRSVFRDTRFTFQSHAALNNIEVDVTVTLQAAPTDCQSSLADLQPTDEGNDHVWSALAALAQVALDRNL